MLNTGRFAAPQYQKIMAQGTDYFKLTIQNYLDARAREDELFAPRYANPKKNIDDCCTFIINQVRQSGCNGFADGTQIHKAIAGITQDLHVLLFGGFLQCIAPCTAGRIDNMGIILEQIGQADHGELRAEVFQNADRGHGHLQLIVLAHLSG